ncbi:TPA: hypothetical protein HA372_03035 [Candidatus Woesearchaeota archaeon]|nr:hypothetical protein [Candidatus Woesearchaeota archaeon]HIJ18638.1 hypothetical protein [Candidatus Woesearchaeota archaeon]
MEREKGVRWGIVLIGILFTASVILAVLFFKNIVQAEKQLKEKILSPEEIAQKQEFERFFNREQQDAATEFFGKIKSNPDVPESYVGLGRLYYGVAVKFGNEEPMQKARGYFQSAIAADPDYAPAHAEMGWVFLSSLEFDRARGEFERALSLNQTKESWLGKSWALYGAGKYNDALASFEKTAAFSGNFSGPGAGELSLSALAGLGWSDYRVGEFALGKQYLEQAGNDSVVRIGVAAAEYALGDAKASQQLLDSLHLDKIDLIVPGGEMNIRGPVGRMNADLMNCIHERSITPEDIGYCVREHPEFGILI